MTSSGGHDRLTSWREREADASIACFPTAGWLWAPCWPSSHRRPRSLGAAPTLAVAVAAGCWVAWFVTLHPGWQSRRRLMAVYYVGLLTFAAALVAASPWYGFFAWIGYIHAFPVLPGRWRVAGVVDHGRPRRHLAGRWSAGGDVALAALAGAGAVQPGGRRLGRAGSR